MRTAALGLLLLACSDPPTHVLSSLPDPEHEAAPSVPPPTEPPTTPTTATTPPPASAAPRLRVSAETAADVQRLVREARTLEHDGDHAAALSRFDEALRLVPSQPRILCEAGFIAHRAGDDALAGRRIDAALAVFGEPRRVSERLRVPLAMCLYNRGLVAEAEADPRRAVDAFTSSIALRPNAAVDAALARARAAAAALAPASRPVADDRSTVAGLELTDDYTLATTDVAAYERALRSGFRGVNWDGTYSPASETVVARRPLATDGHPAVLLHTVTTSDGITRLVVSWPQSTGYQAQELELARLGEESDVEERLEVTELTGTWTGEYLRVDVTVAHHVISRLFYAGDAEDERCEEDSEEDMTRSWTVLCHNESDPDGEFFGCVELPTRVESSGVTSYVSCGDDENEQRTPPSLARAVVVTDAGGVTISQVRDPDALLGVEEGHQSWEELFFANGHEWMLTEWIADGVETE